MYCRYCGTELKKGTELCGACGKDNSVNEKPKKKLTPKQVKAIVAIVLAVAILIPVVFFGVKGVLYLTKENDLYFKSNYSVSAEKIDKYANEVVAVSGDHTLTNAQLQVFYWMRIYEYLNKYSSSYLTFTMDFTKPLSEQICDETTGMTWEQYFLEDALYVWHRYTALADAAEKEGYTLLSEEQEILDGLRASAEEAAAEANAENVDAFIQTEMGAGITFADYENCVKLSYLATSYYNYQLEQLQDEVTDAEIEAYFIRYQDTLKNTYQITKDSGDLVAVRHILIQVETSGEDEDGEAVSTDADWEACREKAQEILNEYCLGVRKEERFAELANQYSEDSGSNQNGGLYTGINSSTNFVKPFLEWCLDENRYGGEVELVKTSYGYHVMYYVNSEPGWIQYCRAGATSEKCGSLADSLMENLPIQTDFKKIAMAEFVLS